MTVFILFILSVPESINSDHNTSPLFIFQIAKKTMFLKLMASLSLSMNISQEDLGQAHDMFSRIFLNTNLRIFSTKFHAIFFFWFSQLLKTEKNLLKKFVDSYIISFSSFEQPTRIPNFCNEFFVYLLFEYFYNAKVLNYYHKNANITLYIKKIKTLCNTLNLRNCYSGFV